jgi:signal transduction histidine kinase
MSELASLLHVRGSVFAKLVAVMLAMAAILLALIVAFFLLYLGPVMNASIDGVVHEYMHTVAATAPGNVQTRYEGPDGTWATADNLPSVEEARRHGHGSIGGRHYLVMPAKNGGSYLFAWTVPQRMYTAHLVVPALVLLLVAAVVFVTHGVLKRVLLPLRWLGDGVTQLSEGHLDVVVPKRSGDEFGTLTDAFNRMVRRVKDMIRARDQLLLDVSHELRSPLTRLKVALELIDDTEMKSRMAADVAEMEMMIGELLELERLRDGSALKTTRQNLVAVLDDVVQGFRDRSPGVHVATTTPEILVEIDADRMRSVVRNLLENAVKYSLPDSAPIQVSAAQNGEHVVIRITDDGPGIPEGDQANLFQPFFRVDRSRSKKTGGYGLGLSIAKRIVEAHGGTIAIEHNAARGASFVVMLPKAA